MDLDDDELKATRILNGADKCADKMFEDLGYTILNDKRSGRLLHYIKSSNLSANESEHIVFLERKEIDICYTYCNFRKQLTMQELKAINQKCKELGWI